MRYTVCITYILFVPFANFFDEYATTVCVIWWPYLAARPENGFEANRTMYVEKNMALPWLRHVVMEFL